MYIRVMPIQHITDTTFSEGVFFLAYIWNDEKTRLEMRKKESTALTKESKHLHRKNRPDWMEKKRIIDSDERGIRR